MGACTVSNDREPYVSRVANARGQGMAEYIIIVILIAVGVIIGIRMFGGTVTNQFENATDDLTGMRDDAQQGSTENKKPAAPASSQAARSSQFSGDSDESIGGESTGSSAGVSGVGNDAEFESLKAKGIADSDEKSDEISIAWRTVGIIGFLIAGIGIYLIVRTAQKTKKLTGKTKKKKKDKKKAISFKRGKGQSGQAMAEFVIIAITFLFTILGVIQLAMVLNAQSLVRYAAYNAARAGIVHNGDKDKMLEAARLSLLATFPSHGRADHRLGMVENYEASLVTDQDPGLTFLGRPITDVELLGPAVDRGGVVTFDDPSHAENAIITVLVTHEYELVIPLVNRTLFYVYALRHGLAGSRDTLDKLSARTNRLRRTGAFRDIEYRIPLKAVYTMRMQSDFIP